MIYTAKDARKDYERAWEARKEQAVKQLPNILEAIKTAANDGKTKITAQVLDFNERSHLVKLLEEKGFTIYKPLGQRDLEISW
jgi:hypothetical protein